MYKGSVTLAFAGAKWIQAMSLMTLSVIAVRSRRLPKWGELRAVFFANLSKCVSIVRIALSAISLPTASFPSGLLKSAPLALRTCSDFAARKFPTSTGLLPA